MRKKRFLSMISVIIVSCILFFAIGIKDMPNAATTKVKVKSQSIADFYFTDSTSSVVDAASQFTLEDENEKKYKAICVDYPDVAPPNGTELTMKRVDGDRKLMTVFYYGYGGPAEWSGFNTIPTNGATSLGKSKSNLKEAYARVATTICASSVRSNKTPTNPIALPFWNFLFGKDSNVKLVENATLSFSKEKPGVGVATIDKVIVQKTDTIKVNGASGCSVNVSVNTPFTMYCKKSGNSEFKKMSAGTVSLAVGDEFYIIAPITYTGKYEIKKKYVNEPNYYMLVATPKDSKYQTVAGLYSESVYAGNFEATFVAPTGGIKVQKKSSLDEITDNNQCYSLEGAEFGVYSSKSDAEGNKNKVKSLKTDKDGLASCDGLNYGDYYIRELVAPAGYELDSGIYSVTINGKHEYETVSIIEKPKLVDIGILLNKIDEDNMPIKDAMFEVCFYGINYTGDKAGLSAITQDRTWYFITDEAGVCKFSWEYTRGGDSPYLDENDNVVLPYGTVTIKEISAPSRYIISDELYVINLAEPSDKSLVVYNAPTFLNYEMKGRIDLTKKGIKHIYENDKQLEKELVLSGIKFKIYAAEDIYSQNHVLKYKKDALVTEIVTNESGYAATTLLPLGKYRISETASNENSHFVIAGDTVTEISEYKSKKQENFFYEPVLVVNNGIIPEISTKAYNFHIDSSIVAPCEEAKLVDTVSYDNVVVGAKYKLCGYLYDADTKEPVLDGDNNVIKAEKEFVAENKNGAEEVLFTVPYELLKNKRIVIFEELIEEGEVIAIHKDFEDENQTLYFPVLSTLLEEKNTGGKLLETNGLITLTDTIHFDKLKSGTYDVKSALYVKETGELLQISEKGGQYLETSFFTETGSGEHKVEFLVDSSLLAEKTVVCYEYLYLDGKPVYSHEDIDDKEQSVGFYEVTTEEEPPTTTEEPPTTTEEPPITTETQSTTETQRVTTELLGSTEVLTTEEKTTTEQTTEIKDKDGGHIKTGDDAIKVFGLFVIVTALMFVVMKIKDK